MEVVVYQQPELLAYYPVCLVCPCRIQRKQPVMQMTSYVIARGCAAGEGRWRQESSRERGRYSRIEDLMLE